MIYYLIYTETTGAINGFGSCPDFCNPEDVTTYGNKALIIEAPIDVDSHWVSNGEVLLCAPRPSAFHQMVNGEWVISDAVALSVKKTERNGLLTITDWYSTRQRDQMDGGEDPTLTPAQWSELLAYRQDLRKWPVTGDYREPFPAKPGWMN